MDIGKLNITTDFYSGYEGENEIILTVTTENKITIHIWDGYFENIFGSPIITNTDWKGFTKDYQERVRTFSCTDIPIIVEPTEYLLDMKQYINNYFSYDESNACLNAMINLFEYALLNSSTVTVIVQ